MRKVLLFVLLVFSIGIKAQTPQPFGFTGHSQQLSFGNPHFPDSTSHNRWFFSRYSAVSTGFSFFNGGSAGFLAVPFGLQLNRRLNNNLYAFAGVSAAPAYINFNRSFMSPDFNKAGRQYGLLHSSNFGMYSRAELGLMYVNDEKTFSISGSIGVESSSYPLFPLQQTGAGRSGRPVRAGNSQFANNSY